MLATALWPTAAWAVATKPLNAVSFSDSDHGVIVGSPNGVDGVRSWTSNGGDSWHASVVSNSFFVGVASAAGGTVAAVPNIWDGLYGSSNFGVEWAPESPLLTRDISLSGVAYLTGSRRVVVGTLNDEWALMASSLNNGAWAIDPVGPDHGLDPDTGQPITHAALNAIDAIPGGDVAWAVGSDRTTVSYTSFDPLIYKTINGGSTWATETPLPAAGAYIKCVAAADADTAFVGRANTTLLRTRDGSAWAPMPSLPATWGITAINAIDAYDANHVLVACNSGRIAWTSNASADVPTWTLSIAAASNALLGAQMIDANNWIIVGDNETILRTTDAGAHWAGPKTQAAPMVAITTNGAHLLDSATVSIEGTSSDGLGIGVAKVEVRVQRADGKFWNGSDWTADAAAPSTWIEAVPNTTNNLDGWHKDVSILSTASAGGSLTVFARATDGLGLPSTNVPSVGAASPSAFTLQQTSITVAYHGVATIKGVLKSGGSPVGSAIVRLNPAQSPYAPTITTDANGNFAFLRAPSTRTTYTLSFAADARHKATSAQVTVIPKVKLNTPVVPKTTIRSTRYFKVYGDMYPKHGSGGRLTFIFQRYQKVGSKYAWVTKKTVSAPAVTVQSWSRATVSVKLPVGVSWRVQTKHADTGHATSYSPWKGFRVR
jgi:photosystem II stability/assembly factor-like uncharacterized protein